MSLKTGITESKNQTIDYYPPTNNMVVKLVWYLQRA